MLSKAPLLWLACCYIFGEIVSKYISPNISIVLISSSFTYLTALYFIPRKKVRDEHKKHIFQRVGTKALLIACGVLLVALGAYRYRDSDITLSKPITLLNDRVYSAKFEIIEAPTNFLNGSLSGNWNTRASIQSINNKRPDHYTEVILKGRGDSKFLRGDIIATKYILNLSQSKPNFPNAFSYSRYLHIKGISTSIKILGDYEIVKPCTPSLLRFTEYLRAGAIQNILYYASAETKGFLAAALFGYRDDLDKSTKDTFRATGIGHILAISGLHVGLIILLTNFLCRRLHLSPRRTALITLLVCTIFLLLSGGRSAVLRASIVAYIYLGGVLIYRRSNFINSLGAAALIICAINPLQIHDIGFQLSFISVVFISILSHKYIELLNPLRPDISLRNKPYKYFFHALPYNISLLMIVTLAAWLGVFPLTAYFFSEVSLIGFLTNLLVIPLMPFTIAGGLLLELSPLLPSMAVPAFSTICCFPASIILTVCNVAAKLPITSISLFPPTVLQISLYYLVFLALFVSPKSSIINKSRISITTSMILAVIVSIFYTGRIENKISKPEIDIIRSRNGESAVISGAIETSTKNSKPPSMTPYTFLVVQDSAHPSEIINYLYYKKIRKIDKLFYISKTNKICSDYMNKLNIDEIVYINKIKKDSNLEIFLNKVASITITRSDSGRILWYNYKNNGINALVSNWQSNELYNKLIDAKYPGYNSPIQFLRITGRRTLKHKNIKGASSKTLPFILRDKDIGSDTGRKNFGVIQIKRNSIRGWSGTKFIELNPVR